MDGHHHRLSEVESGVLVRRRNHLEAELVQQFHPAVPLSVAPPTITRSSSSCCGRMSTGRASSRRSRVTSSSWCGTRPDSPSSEARAESVLAPASQHAVYLWKLPVVDDHPDIRRNQPDPANGDARQLLRWPDSRCFRWSAAVCWAAFMPSGSVCWPLEVAARAWRFARCSRLVLVGSGPGAGSVLTLGPLNGAASRQSGRAARSRQIGSGDRVYDVAWHCLADAVPHWLRRSAAGGRGIRGRRWGSAPGAAIPGRRELRRR